MFVYVVMNFDPETGNGESINSIYDEEGFKKQYKNFLSHSGLNWNDNFEVFKVSLNDNEDKQYFEFVNSEDFEVEFELLNDE